MSIASINSKLSDARWHAAWVLARGLAWGLSLFRPITEHSEEVYEDDGHGGEICRIVTDPNVFVSPLKALPFWRIEAWVHRDAKECSLNVHALGCDIEIFFQSRSSCRAR